MANRAQTINGLVCANVIVASIASIVLDASAMQGMVRDTTNRLVRMRMNGVVASTVLDTTKCDCTCSHNEMRLYLQPESRLFCKAIMLILQSHKPNITQLPNPNPNPNPSPNPNITQWYPMGMACRYIAPRNAADNPNITLI